MTAYHLGFTRRKSRFLEQFIGESARALGNDSTLARGDTLYAWGDTSVPGDVLGEATLVRVEDGFIRSAGLGAMFAPPLSWTFDRHGLHHWSHQLTDLENCILSCANDRSLLARAAALRRQVVLQRVTKYNLPPQAVDLPARTLSRRRVLVIGQVADDAALRGVRTPVRTNMELLAAVRARCPAAELIYRPHPDVVAGVRDGDDDQWATVAQVCSTRGSLEQLLLQVDEVHVMNSLSGFEALIRRTPVVCYAQPFYAGWGLTVDVFRVERRPPASLDQLVAAALIKYPKYRHPVTGQLIEVEEALQILAEIRRGRSTGLMARLPHAFVAGAARMVDRIRARHLRGMRHDA